MPTQAAQKSEAIPPSLAEVALIDCNTAAAAASISVSQWHKLVSEGKAPQPAFRSPRCTRWRIADVRAWLIERSSQDIPSGDSRTVDIARRASAASRAKRAGLYMPAGA